MSHAEVLFSISRDTGTGRHVPRALFSVSKKIHESACRIAFASVSLPDDGRLFNDETSQYLLPIPGNAISAFLLNPERYADYIERLCITDPICYGPVGDISSSDASNLGIFGTFGEERQATLENEDGTPRIWNDDQTVAGPIPSRWLRELLGLCENIGEIVWTSSYLPPDGLCDVSVVTSRL